MASFKVHLLASGVATYEIIHALHPYPFFLSEKALFIGAALGIIGGIMPDVDLKDSTPFKMLFSFLSLAVATLVFSELCRTHSWEQSALYAFVSAIAVKIVVQPLAAQFTVHRGVFHSIPAAFLMGMVGVWTAFKVAELPPFTAWFLGAILMINYLLHLLIDELWSFNPLTLKEKRSFGTALTLISFKDPLPYIIVAAIGGALFHYMPGWEEFYAALHLMWKNL